MRSPRPTLLVLLAVAALAGCRSKPPQRPGTPPPPPPPAGAAKSDGERPLLDRILYGPTDEPVQVRSDRRRDAQRENKPWWETAPPSPERVVEKGEFRAETGWYLGVLGATVMHSDRDLDGQQFLSGADTIVLPDVDAGSGPGAVLGYRFPSMAFEVAYLRTTHDGEWLGTPFDVEYDAVSIDFKQFFALRSRLQPYVTAGFATSRLHIENGASNGTVIDDATLSDEISLKLGGGFAIYLTRRIALSGHVVYRLLEVYNEGEGVAPKRPVAEVDNGSFSGVVSLTFTF